MHDMSNTRKEIAARLGFAAMGPAPLKGSPARKAEIAQGKESAAERKKAKLIKDNAVKIKDIERDYNSAMSQLKKMFALLPKKFAEIRTKAAKGEIDAEDYEYDLNEVGRAIEQYNDFLEDIRFARSGVKAAFAASLSEIKAWSQALKKEEQASLKTQKANERANRGEYDIDSATEVRVFSGLNAALQRGDKLLVRKLLDEAKREIDATVFRQGVPQALIAWANTTTASRPGAKASFGRAEDVYRLLETTPGSYANYKKRDALVTEAMRLADITPAGKDVSLHELAEMVGQDLEADRSRMSRSGTKTRMTRDQTEEQKAGLKIMSAADPAVGAKIATLIKEGKPQDQAVAIALDMKRRGEL